MIWRNCRYRKCQQKYQKHYSCWKMTCCWPLLSGGLYIALCGVESFQWWRKERSVEDIMRSCTFCHIEYSVEQLTIKTPPLLRMTNGTKKFSCLVSEKTGTISKDENYARPIDDVYPFSCLREHFPNKKCIPSGMARNGSTGGGKAPARITKLL